MATIASFVGTTDKRLWRVINHYVAAAMKNVDLSGLEAFSLDETSCRRGHRYVTIFIDLDREDRPVVFVTEGKGKQTVQRFREHLLDKGGHPDRVLEVVSDMSGGFVAAVAEHFPKADVTVDWFHGNAIRGLICHHEPERFHVVESASLANQAAAFDKISSSSRSCLFSRRNLRSSSHS